MYSDKRYNEAEALLLQALKIRKQVPEPEHPVTLRKHEPHRINIPTPRTMEEAEELQIQMLKIS